MASLVICPQDATTGSFSFRRGARLADKKCPTCGGPLKLIRWLLPKELRGYVNAFEEGFHSARLGFNRERLYNDASFQRADWRRAFDHGFDYWRAHAPAAQPPSENTGLR